MLQEEEKKTAETELGRLQGQTLHINKTDIYRAVINPIWAFVVFQTNRLNDQLKNNSEFGHANVKNL